MNFLKIFAIMICAAALYACTAQQELQTSVDQNILKYTVGKPYTEIAGARSTEGLLMNEPAYGKLIGQSKISSGDTLYRHVSKHEASGSYVGIGLIGGTEKRIDYRIFVFRVSADGLIKDYANGVLSGEKINCLDFIGGLIQNCDNAELLSTDAAQMDTVVRTSTGGLLSSWV